MTYVKLVLQCSLWLCVFKSLSVAGEDRFKKTIEPFLENYCLDCHDSEVSKGDLSLEPYLSIKSEDASVWKQVWEQIALKSMPPHKVKEKNMPSLLERHQMSHDLLAELEKVLASEGGFEDHLNPKKGNHIDHDLLFNAELKNLSPVSSPSRIWRITPWEQLVRISDLFYHEPYNPKTPGARTHGDALESLVLFEGPSVYVKGRTFFDRLARGKEIHTMLTTKKSHGIRSYPHLFKLNGATAERIMRNAKDIVRYMMDPPDKKAQTNFGVKFKFDVKEAKVAKTLIEQRMRPLETRIRSTPVADLVQQEKLNDTKLKEAIEYLYFTLTGLEISQEDRQYYTKIANEAISVHGLREGVVMGLSPIFLDHHALYRSELAMEGKPDAYGRVMLQDEELMLAINSAFSFLKPDVELIEALRKNKLKTRSDVKAQVTRILNDPSIRKPRILQFFREYFDYGLANQITKDGKAIFDAGAMILSAENIWLYPRSVNQMVADTDRLVELIVQEDKDVLKELLTTDRVVYSPNGETISYYMTKTERALFYPTVGSYIRYTREHRPNLINQGDRIQAYEKALGERAGRVLADVGTPIQGRMPQNLSDRGSERMLGRVKPKERMGILTHPAWLIAHSDAMDNHVIHRGMWIRERLLGGAVPDVPVTVDAMLPVEPDSTLRHRMRVTRENQCWRCHQYVDPLGLPFERYNHIGLYRKQEKGNPVNTSGNIFMSGDPKLDGPVGDAIEMIKKIASSERAEQVFVRHVFRFWMGRNETLDDAPILRSAHRAYRGSGGSLKALLIELITSDAFLYRKVL